MMLYLRRERKQQLVGLGVITYVCTHMYTHTLSLTHSCLAEVLKPESKVSLAQDQCALIFPVTLGKGAFCQNGPEN